MTIAKNYKGAEYRTKEAFVYGRFEVRYKPARKEGVVSSFFTYHEFTNQTGWNEIDIEFIGRNDNHVQFNIITPNQKFHIRNQYLDFDPYLDFHDYAFEWTPDYVAYFVDGVEVWKTQGDFVKTLQYPQKIMMNIWNPVYTNWVGTWNDAYLPAIAEYDYISYSSYTPGTGNLGTSNNFTFQWKDELDFFDESRWEKATHTFGGNQADFIQENAVFSNSSSMYLCLTNETDLGYVDKVKPIVLYARENFDKSITCVFSEEVDSTSAVNKSNYVFPGLSISSIEFQTDRRSVKIFSSNFDTSITYNLIVSNIEDKFGNKLQLKATTLIKKESLAFPIKINVGGGTVDDYLPDQEWSPRVEYGYQMGDVKKWPDDLIISGTDEQAIFHTERKGLLAYKIRVPNGNYSVKLLFADKANTAIGERVFDIYCEGNLIKENLDLISEVNKNTAFELNADISVNDEKIDIYFCDDADSAFVNAIIISQIPNSVGDNEIKNGMNFYLHQNYPNPFNPYTKIKYIINVPEFPKNVDNKVSLEVFDILGRKVQTLIDDKYNKGENEVVFDGSQLASGVYLYKLNCGNFSQTKKLVLIK